MGHVSHIIIVEEHNPADAMACVESYLEGWGGENNWSCIDGAVGVDGNFDEGEGDLGEYTTIEKLNELVRSWIKVDVDLKPEDLEEIQQATLFPEKTEDHLAFYHLEKWAKAMRNIKMHKTDLKKFDILKDEYKAYEFTETGVTHIDTGDGTGKKFAVLFDMHY